MRSVLLLSALAALSLGAPHPQDIDYTLVDAAETPETTSAPVDGDINDTVVNPVNVALAVGSAAPTAMARRAISTEGLLKRDGDCAPQPNGTGPVASPDTPNGFLATSAFPEAANDAQAPAGYTVAFTNLQASSQTTSYLGYKTLDSYDPIACAEYCNQLSGCQAFNIYFERDPSLDPNSSQCPNPPSVTNIKCVRWGIQIHAETATNSGQWRDGFQVVIAGSNGYNKDAPPSAISGFTGPTELGGAMQAPLDPQTKQNTYMGYKFFAFGTGENQVQYYSPCVCTAACSAQTAYDARHPPATGNPNVCNQVVAYVLSRNNIPQGMYCAMYTEAWAPEYATNYGQYRGSDFYSVSQAYSFTADNYTYPPICAIGGCPSGSYGGGNCGGWGPGTCSKYD